MLWIFHGVILITLLLIGVIESAQYTRKHRLYNLQMPRLQKPTDLYDNPSSFKPKVWSDRSNGRAFLDDENSESRCNVFPNKTLFEPHFFSCDSQDKPPTFVVHDIALSNRTGDYIYPLDFAQTLRVFLDMTSYSNRRFDNMRAEVELYRRTTGWLGCGWLKIPSFGLLDNYDVCAENNLSCLIYPGRQVFELSLYPSFIFSGFLQMIHSDRVPYQLIIRLVSNRSSADNFLCVVLQSRIQF